MTAVFCDALDPSRVGRMVISALAKESMVAYHGCTATRTPTHVPFRNATLTRLLQVIEMP